MKQNIYEASHTENLSIFSQKTSKKRKRIPKNLFLYISLQACRLFNHKNHHKDTITCTKNQHPENNSDNYSDCYYNYFSKTTLSMKFFFCYLLRFLFFFITQHRPVLTPVLIQWMP